MPKTLATQPDKSPPSAAERLLLTGNEAVARAVVRSRVQVVSAYPITPQTTIIEELATLIHRGELKARYINVESEHSAMAGCIAATSAGARSFTATSAQGLALMHELLHWAGGGRLPIVLANVNRSMAPGWAIWTDQNDSLSQRDTGWIQFYCEENQEVVDTVIQAFKIAETVMLPVMVVLDAFVLSHTAEAVELPSQEDVDAFLPPYHPPFKLDLDKPSSFGALMRPECYQEFRQKAQLAMEQAIDVIHEVDEDWHRRFGRRYGLVETYGCEDADLVFVASATVASTARIVIDKLRRQGRKVGLLKVRLFRPFPFHAVRTAVRRAKKLAVFDRNISYGHHGIFCQEIKSALYGAPASERPEVFGYVGGLGGRDVTPEMIEEVIDRAAKTDRQDGEFEWVGVRGAD